MEWLSHWNDQDGKNHEEIVKISHDSKDKNFNNTLTLFWINISSVFVCKLSFNGTETRGVTEKQFRGSDLYIPFNIEF